MAEAPKLPLTETPEFKAAVKSAVVEAAPSIIAAALAEMGKTKPVAGVDASTQDFFANMSQTIAMAVAEISDQGTSRKRVAPEILASREAAEKKCHELIRQAHLKVKEARHSGNKDQESVWSPEYKVVSKVYFGERMIEPFRRNPDKSVVAQEIIWFGVPNDALRPVNPVAVEIYEAFKDSVGSTGRLKSIRGAHGGIVAQDTRPVWMTPGGLVVKGDPPPKAFVAAPLAEDDLGFKDNNDPNAPEVHVLGTIAAPAKRNTLDTRAP